MTMNRSFFILLGTCFILLSNGCRQSKTAGPEPKQILDRQTMVMLMADMDITDAALKVRQIGLSHDSIRKLSGKAFDSLYIYYGTTPDVFKENIKYYQRNMEDYQKMMDEKLELLSRKKDSIDVAIEPVKIDTSRNRKSPVVKVNPGKK